VLMDIVDRRKGSVAGGYVSTLFGYVPWMISRRIAWAVCLSGLAVSGDTTVPSV